MMKLLLVICVSALSLLLNNKINAYPGQPQFDVTSYILINADSGTVLAAQEPNKRIQPASVTKMMTAYIIEKNLTSGKVNKDQRVPISKIALTVEGARILNPQDTSVRLDDLLQGMITLSGNDASIALAEFIAGSEANFSILMNQEARRLGMNHTHFVNSNGLSNVNHYSTATDLAILARALITDFPLSYSRYSKREFTYNNITKTNPNLLLWRDSSVDGIKTGYTQAAGYCLVASAKRNGVRLISVMMGAKSPEARAQHSEALLDYGYSHLK